MTAARISHSAAAGAEYERLATQLIATPAPRLALFNRTGAEQDSHVQQILKHSAVRAHFSDRCALVSCDNATSTEVAIACLASGLGLEPSDNNIGTILSHLKAVGRTLVVLDNLDAIYSPADPEQQEATDVLLATLAAVDDITLVITFCGSPLPECVVWISMDDTRDDAPKSELQATDHLYHVATPAVTLSDPACATQDDRIPPVFKADGLVHSPSNTMVTGFDVHERESLTSQTPARPITISQSKVPPPKPTVFHGRDKEVERLVAQSVVPSSAPIGIVGPGGIGKTTLALKVLHDSRVKQHYGRERFFLTCEGANGPDEVLSHLAGKLNVQRSQDETLWSAVLDNLRSRQRVFLLIDNFESIWSPTNNDLREASEVFLAQLAVLDEVTLLVTTRGNILPESFTWANINTAELDTLSSTAARMTFTDLSDLEPHVLESEPEAKALTELMREIDFMPLAIKLLARLGDLPSSLLLEWSEHRSAVLEADRHDGSRRELSVEVSIKISLAHLPVESVNFRPRQLLSVMGQLPAGLFPRVSGDLRSTIPNLDSAAQNLLRHSLVYIGGYNELRMLSPVRHYVSACFPMSATTLSAVDEIYISIAHTHPSAEHMDADGPAYDLELPNVIHVFAAALNRGSDEVLADAALRLAAYCSVRNQFCLPLMQRLAPHFKSGTEMKARFLLIVSGHYDWKDEIHLAVQSLEQSAELYAKLGDKSREAYAWGKLSRISGMQGRSEDARRQETRSQALERESEPSNFSYRLKPGEDLMLAEQRFREDRKTYLQARNVRAVQKLSELILKIVADRGDDVAYIRELELVVALYEQTQPALQIGSKKGLLAERYMISGRIIDAELLLIHAYTLLSSTNDRGSIATVTASFGRLRTVQGRLREAAEHFEAASEMFRVVGDTLMAAELNHGASLIRMHIATWD